MSKGTSLAEFDTKYDIIDAQTPRHTVLSGRYKRYKTQIFFLNFNFN